MNGTAERMMLKENPFKIYRNECQLRVNESNYDGSEVFKKTAFVDRRECSILHSFPRKKCVSRIQNWEGLN